MKIRLKQVNQHTYEQWSEQIANLLYEQSVWLEAKTIGLTVPMPREVNTRIIMEQAWKQDKQVATPKCIPSQRKMDFRQIESESDLEQSYAGLYEPIPEKTLRIEKNEIDLLIVPGLCFDQSGYRLGFGGGYFDRYLEGFRNHTVALAFDFQVLSYIPTEKYDLNVDFLITNKGVQQFE
ncbi:5-formyltetrahydrofolate cyclo-ligase [Bacillus solimangrovi]|uniref:5-formyltetrahydrofolate cyclo-ligase n=2 Tax=Bacillus solimangrovi TaxID=1305675 RepID=A0A1E5LFS5_9BACI|nr:5-formyltetrahydrofolate cyclo-ligase [Bacillus solimangrovi]